jgi:uncharacterized protein (DUF488 family)
MGGIIQPKVWTIGHSTRPVEEFLALLRENGIEVLADVRRYPGSRRHPQFGEAQMAASLRDAGVNYEHMPELGGRRPALRDSPNTAWRNTAFRGYADHMETSEFADGTNRLMNLATSKRLTIMCAEALWWQCHRGLIADYLKVRGWKVLHIMGPGKVEEHPYTSAAKVVDGKLSYRSHDELPFGAAGCKFLNRA